MLHPKKSKFLECLDENLMDLNGVVDDQNLR